MPYTQECNDVAMMLIQHHKASEYRDRAIDQFDSSIPTRTNRRASWRSWCIPTSWASPHRLRYFREALEHIQSRSGRRVLDRRADSRLVSAGTK